VAQTLDYRTPPRPVIPPGAGQPKQWVTGSSVAGLLAAASVVLLLPAVTWWFALSPPVEPGWSRRPISASAGQDLLMAGFEAFCLAALIASLVVLLDPDRRKRSGGLMVLCALLDAGTAVAFLAMVCFLNNFSI